MEALRRREPGAANQLFMAYGRDVQRVSARVAGTDQLADLVHDVFVRALERVDELRDARRLRSWLVGISVYAAREHIRRRQRERRIALVADPEAPSAGSDLDAREELRRVYGILEGVDVDDRIAFALRYLEGMELTEVAAACGTSLATIKRRISRAEVEVRRAAAGDPALAARLQGEKR